MKAKLQRAEEKRLYLLRLKANKAAVEEQKAHEIAFINNLVAQNRRHDILGQQSCCGRAEGARNSLHQQSSSPEPPPRHPREVRTPPREHPTEHRRRAHAQARGAEGQGARCRTATPGDGTAAQGQTQGNAREAANETDKDRANPAGEREGTP